MLEYFTYKKVKKHQAEKHAREAALKTPKEKEKPRPLLNEEDELFLERIVSAEGTPPPLPERPIFLNEPEVGDSSANDAQLVKADQEAVEAMSPGNATTTEKTEEKGKGKEREHANDTKKAGRFSFFRRTSKKAELQPTNPDVPAAEATKEEEDINRILDELNLSAVNNRAFSLSAESQQLVQKFTVILKDLVNGVPTAYDDLVNLIEDSQGTLAKSYDHLPAFLQKLITSLPNKLTSTLAPELLAVAAEAQALGGMSAAEAGKGGLGAAAKAFLTPSSLKDLVTKPGAVAGLLKGIMNALKLRWPAFMGTNVLLSLGLFILLFVFWYCHKRGREVRLAAEGKSEGTVDGDGRITELNDDPMLGNGEGSSGTTRDVVPTPAAAVDEDNGRSTGAVKEAIGEVQKRK